MRESIFKKTLVFSLLGHLTVFGLFSFSFGSRLPRLEYQPITFWGQILGNTQVSSREVSAAIPRGLDFKKLDTSILEAKSKEPPLLTSALIKPPQPLIIDSQKQLFVESPQSAIFPLRREEPAVIFHPMLPYSFPLYFQDRQVAHVELMFKLESAGLQNSILVKRKISSGNLEVDLLVSRYIGHYLFVRQPSFQSGIWQTVKIDLSANDTH
jgi:hypothetical protein